MRIVFAGTPDFAATALEAIITAGFNIVATYTQPNRPAGRGMKLMPSAVKQRALAHNIPVYQPITLKAPEAQAELSTLAPDIIVVVAYGLILPQAVLDIPRHGCLNIHASLLPRWRGAAPIQRAILAGDAETGVGIMQMEAGLDTGAILLERRLTIAARETTGSLHDRLATLGSEAIVQVLTALRTGASSAAKPQPDSTISYAHKISPQEAAIDWAQPADIIDRQIRAFDPVPGAWTIWQGEKLKIWHAEPMTGSVADTQVGRIVGIERERLLIVCGVSTLAIYEIQRAGGKRMSVSSWLSGSAHPRLGDCLG